MFYSHMMDTASDQPVLRLQNENNMDTLKDVQEITSLLPTTSNLFEKKVDANMVIIISGVNSGNFAPCDCCYYCEITEKKYAPLFF